MVAINNENNYGQIPAKDKVLLIRFLINSEEQFWSEYYNIINNNTSSTQLHCQENPNPPYSACFVYMYIMIITLCGLFLVLCNCGSYLAFTKIGFPQI